MARENFVLMHGQVRGEPRITIDNDGVITKAMFTMRMLRRPTINAENINGKLQIDCPVIYTRNQELAQMIQGLKAGDMVDVRGVISSKECRKSTIFPECEHKNIKDGNANYIEEEVIERMMETFGYTFDEACHIAGYKGEKKDRLATRLKN